MRVRAITEGRWLKNISKEEKRGRVPDADGKSEEEARSPDGLL